MARTAGPSDLATPASCTGQGDQIGTTGGATTWGPADTTALTTARPASAESEVRPGPRPPTLRAHRAEARQAEPEALATPSLPTMPTSALRRIRSELLWRFERCDAG